MPEFHPGFIVNAAVFALLGILLFIIAFVVIDKLTPYSLWKEIVRSPSFRLNGPGPSSGAARLASRSSICWVRRNSGVWTWR